MTERWPVPGHTFWYKTGIKLDSGYELAFDMTVPGTMPEWHLSTARLGRHGGETNADQMFRKRLYQRIGAVTVAGGHAETAMKRLLLLLRGKTAQFSKADVTWTELHDELVRQQPFGG